MGSRKAWVSGEGGGLARVRASAVARRAGLQRRANGRPTFVPPSPCSVDPFGDLVLHSPAYSRDAGYPALSLRSVVLTARDGGRGLHPPELRKLVSTGRMQEAKLFVSDTFAACLKDTRRNFCWGGQGIPG